MLEEIAIALPSTRREFRLEVASRARGVLTGCKVKEIESERLIFVDSEGNPRALTTDIVVLTVGSESDRKLLEETEGLASEVYTIGDYIRARSIIQTGA